MARPLLITDDILALTRWSQRTLDRRLAAGQFPAPVMLSARMRRWHPDDVDAWLEARRAEAMERQQAQVAAAS